MTPSTNKCIKCGEEIPYGATFTRNENGTIQHAPGDWCKPTVPSVCGVVDTYDFVNSTCTNPRPCKDHEVCGIGSFSGQPCLRVKPCPLHDKPIKIVERNADCLRCKTRMDVSLLSWGHCKECSDRLNAQQEEASSKKGKNTRLARHFLSQDLPNRSFKNSHTESGYKLGVYAFASFLDHKK